MPDTVPISRPIELFVTKHEGSQMHFDAYLGTLLLGDKIDFEKQKIRVLEDFWQFIKKPRKKGGLMGSMFGGGGSGGRTNRGALAMEFDDGRVEKKLEINPDQSKRAHSGAVVEQRKKDWKFLQDIIPGTPCHARDSGEIRLLLIVDCNAPPKPPPPPGYDEVRQAPGGGTPPTEPQKITLNITRR